MADTSDPDLPRSSSTASSSSHCDCECSSSSSVGAKRYPKKRRRASERDKARVLLDESSSSSSPAPALLSCDEQRSETEEAISSTSSSLSNVDLECTAHREASWRVKRSKTSSDDPDHHSPPLLPRQSVMVGGCGLGNEAYLNEIARLEAELARKDAEAVREAEEKERIAAQRDLLAKELRILTKQQQVPVTLRQRPIKTPRRPQSLLLLPKPSTSSSLKERLPPPLTPLVPLGLKQHLDGDCPMSKANCPYETFGCTFVSLRKNIESHLDQYRMHHIRLQADSFAQWSQQQKNTAAIQHVMERVASLETQMNAAERLQDALDQRVEFLSDQRERNNDRHGGRIENLEDQALRLTAMVTELKKKVSDIPDPHTGLTSGYVTDSHPGLRSLGASNTTAQRIDGLQAKVLSLDRSIDRCLGSNIDLDMRLQLVERASYNGVLLWKIPDFEHRRREAVDGTTLSLYSTPFYTSEFGYKMCARVYLNSDGLGKNTHLSFFFVLMRGPYDGLLQWPFRQKVTFALINQSGKRHVADSFRPDPDSSSFQRPGSKEMNVASGCPMFIRIDHLLNGGFVKDDSIYLRVVVDTADLPKVPPP